MCSDCEDQAWDLGEETERERIIELITALDYTDGNLGGEDWIEMPKDKLFSIIRKETEEPVESPSFIPPGMKAVFYVAKGTWEIVPIEEEKTSE